MGFFLGDRDISMINPISSSALAGAAFGLFLVLASKVHGG